MARELRVTVLLSAEEFVALTRLSEAEDRSQSGFLRRLFLDACQAHAKSIAEGDPESTAEHAHVLRRKSAK